MSLDSYREEIERIKRRNEALQMLVEFSEDGRKARARILVQNGGVGLADKNWPHRAGVIEAHAAGKYDVALSISDGDEYSRSRVKGYRCSCPDVGRAGACKHVLAVAGFVYLAQTRVIHRMESAVKTLESLGPDVTDRAADRDVDAA